VGESEGPEGARSARRREPPRATTPEVRELFAGLLDPERMLALFRAELPSWSATPLRVTRCRLKPGKTARSRKAIREKEMLVIYTLGIEFGDQPEREVVLLGAAPAGPEHPVLAGAQGQRALLAHPMVAPLGRLAAYLPGQRTVLFSALLDPTLPALAELTGAEAAGLLAAHLPECRAGERIAHVESSLRHFKPLHRAVLRMSVRFSGGGERALYVKLFADGRGLQSYHDLVGLHAAAQRGRDLRVPEPLGYDPRCRMLVMAEAPGPRGLSEWIRRLEDGETLPASELARLERCTLQVARALGDLQRSGLRPTARRTFRSELARLEAERVPDEEGEIARDVERLLAELARLTPAEETLVPAHGGLRHKQTVGDELSLTFLDWDGLCEASPALDAATFLARLRQEPASHPGRAPELERLAELFRAELRATLPAAAESLALYEGLVLTEQLLRSFRRAGRDTSQDATGRCLAAAALQALERAAARG
jgi:hypothetical protein